MFFKKIKQEEQRDDFDPNRVVYLTLTFNDAIIMKTFSFKFEDNTIAVTRDKKTRIGDSAVLCIVATYLSGKRYIQCTRMLKREKHQYIFERNKFQELPERRQAVKVPCKLECRIEAYEIEEFEAEVLNISIGGIFLKTNKELDLGTMCRINIKDLGPEKYITIFRRQEDNSGYGCKFVNLTDGDTRAISNKICDIQREERKAFLRMKGNS